MNRSSDRTWKWHAAGIAAAVLLAVPVAGAEDEASEWTPENVQARTRAIDEGLRGAERKLAESLVVRVRSGDAASDAREAGASIAKLLEAARDDSRRASAAMQWIVDNVPS